MLAVAFSPWDVLRIVLGLPLVLFFPGYTLLLALFPRKDRLGGVERLVLSIGLSIVITAFLGLIINFTAWGITRRRFDPVFGASWCPAGKVTVRRRPQIRLEGAGSSCQRLRPLNCTSRSRSLRTPVTSANSGAGLPTSCANRSSGFFSV